MKYTDPLRVYRKLDSTSKRLEKTFYISKLIEKADKKDLEDIMLLLQGRVFPSYDERRIGVAAKIVVKALVAATGSSQKDVDNEWRKTGDLGEVAKNLVPNKKQQTLTSIEITVRKVVTNIRKLAGLEGQGTVGQKVNLISELLTSANAEEAKYITRTVLETLRIGVGSGAIRDAIVWASFPKVIGIFYRCEKCGEWVPNAKRCIECGSKLDYKFKDFKPEGKVLEIKDASELEDFEKYDAIKTPDEKKAREIYNYLVEIVQKAIDMTNDYAKVAAIARDKGRGGLLDIDLTVGVPINVMLYQKAKNIEDAFKTVGRPCACEYKYDGFRVQVHRKGGQIKLITRRLEDVTRQFPDVVDAVKRHIDSKNYIIDCEIIGVDKKTGRWLAFQSISMRIKRKYEIDQMAKKVPVIVKIFDAMEIDKKNLLNETFEKRRKLIEKITSNRKGKITVAEQIITDNEDEAGKFYQEALDLGNEGIMMKKLEAPYKPGSRVGYGVKIKPVLESLDLVIVGAEWGEGKRKGWLTSFDLACIDDDGNYLEIGKASTGLKEKEEAGLSYSEMTKEIEPLIVAKNGRQAKVKPSVIVEVHYEEIQKSTTYRSGYALRFPRIISRRDDMRPEEISTLDQVEDIYNQQRGR